ncbi:MAG: GatB/YqeY domain-containing protein [Clostridia bacterium]|nr:GatB/YqeY domain-containing protein [Clostridia bacterium]MCI2000905.1 GatB/YqeY domain-containing protein [Clostridia bacterium]MCI2015689.1 GatB/YqeY domain-containing protein [Clostridia bacterium]
MSLKEKLLQDLKEAMKNKETVRKNTIQLIRSGVLQIEKDKQVELDNEGVLDVIAKELKKRRDSMPDFVKSGRQDLIDELNKEIDVLLGYLPEQLTESEIKEIVEQTVKETGASSIKDMGKVMRCITPKVKERADSKIVSTLVKQMLQ